jgi:hypothetical protein
VTNFDGEARADRPRRRHWWWIAGAAAVIVAAAAVVTVVLRGGENRTVRFEVTAEGGEIGEIIYGVTGEPHQVGGPLPGAKAVQSPWSLEYEVPEDARAVSLSASTLIADAPVLTCRILVDGKVRSEMTKKMGVVCDRPAEEILAD